MRTVYIVDDDASVLDSTALLLKLQGFETRTFRSGEEFLANVNSKWSGCLVIDFNLGTMTAVTVLRKLKIACVCLPTIVISSESPRVLQSVVAEFGDLEILEKPAEDGVLEAAIQRALGR